MADEHRPRHDEKSERILAWLREHREEFEGPGVSEAALASSVGLAEQDVRDAVDRLENREAVARVPQHDAPGSFLLQPARGWADIGDELGRGPAAADGSASGRGEGA